MEKGKFINLHIVNGTGTLFQGEAKSIGVMTTSGQITILPDHTALISTVAKGKVEVETANGTEVFPSESGVLDISPDKTVILLHNEIIDSHHAE